MISLVSSIGTLLLLASEKVCHKVHLVLHKIRGLLQTYTAFALQSGGFDLFGNAYPAIYPLTKTYGNNPDHPRWPTGFVGLAAIGAVLGLALHYATQIYILLS